jgi:hypothetical protein
MSIRSVHRRYRFGVSAPRRSWPGSLRVHCVLLATLTLLFGLQVGDEPATFVAAHLDHLEGPGHMCAEQVGEVLDRWGGATRVLSC